MFAKNRINNTSLLQLCFRGVKMMKRFWLFSSTLVLVLAPWLSVYTWKVYFAQPIKSCIGEYDFNFKLKDDILVKSTGKIDMHLRAGGEGSTIFSGKIAYINSEGKAIKETIVYREQLYHYKIKGNIINIKNDSSIARTTDNSTDIDVISYLYSGLKNNFIGNHSINKVAPQIYALGDSQFPRIQCYAGKQ